MSPSFTNRLITESSLYLRQHAHNPVNWFPWGEEALKKAVDEDKPILVSIGYAACHWCHVMERESFEDEQVASFMNEHFINIKIDREERPDIDHIYMDAVQAMTGSGGWPLNVFCTPDKRPFFGGTYFPPRPAFNRISWMELLQRIQQAWENKREGLEQQAARILEHISTSGNMSARQEEEYSGETCKQITDATMQAADKTEGGFGSAPKFPHTLTIRYLLEYAAAFKDKEALAQAELSLQKMIRGGIYDHLGGGLARYSTDDKWLVPHFEKMLYDNALLISALSLALMSTGNQEYEEAIEKTIGFLKNELKDSSGGYYASLDADSEGEEGKFYVWDKKEIDVLLGEDSEIYCRFFGVSENGNWEGTNILHIQSNLEAFAAAESVSVNSLRELINKSNQKLFHSRSERPRPLTDDKILLGWNALYLSALCRAYAASGRDSYRDEAISLADFVFGVFEKDGQLFHYYHKGALKHRAFLDDLAYLIEACLLLQEITGDQDYLQRAEKYIQYAEKYFALESGFYSYTDSRMTDVLLRKTEYYDGAMPSGNSTMAVNLFFLGRILDNDFFIRKSDRMISGMKNLAVKFPVSFSLWTSLIIYKSLPNKDIVITGQDLAEIRKQVLGCLLPGRILLSSSEISGSPLLQGKDFTQNALIYLCINKLCLPPLDNFPDFANTLQSC